MSYMIVGEYLHGFRPERVPGGSEYEYRLAADYRPCGFVAHGARTPEEAWRAFWDAYHQMPADTRPWDHLRLVVRA